VLYHQPVGCAALVAALSATTNIIESPYAGVRIQTRRVTNWQNGSMARRWMASAIPENGEELPQDHALSRTLDSGGDSERIAVSHSTGRAIVTLTQPLMQTFNYARDILLTRNLIPRFQTSLKRRSD
jgi:hypothetical protein